MPLGDLVEEDHHPISALYAHLARQVGEPVGEAGEVAESQAVLLAALSEPDHGRTVFFPPVHHVAAEVEPLGRLPLEVCVRGLVVADVRHDSSLPFPQSFPWCRILLDPRLRSVSSYKLWSRWSLASEVREWNGRWFWERRGHPSARSAARCPLSP